MFNFIEFMEKKTKCLLCREVPTEQPKAEKTFPMFKKVTELDSNGDLIEKFVELSEEEKLNLRASSPFVDGGEMNATSPLPRDKFEVLDEMMNLVDSLTPEEIEELKQLKNK